MERVYGKPQRHHRQQGVVRALHDHVNRAQRRVQVIAGPVEVDEQLPGRPQRALDARGGPIDQPRVLEATPLSSTSPRSSPMP